MRFKNLLFAAVLMLMTSTFFVPNTAFAFTDETAVEAEALAVDAVWLEEEMLQINITNVNAGTKQNLELKLQDYTEDSEFISIQAVDLDGNKSNIIQIENPYYTPKPVEEDGKTENTAESSENGVPFTPEGNGEVMDNASEKDGKEFFTIKTKNDNVFHLIVDRQRGSDNVYLLNAVTEADLLALAEKSGDSMVSAIPEPSPTPNLAEIEPIEKQENEPITEEKSDKNFNFFGLIGIIAVGIAGYYFKIYKPKYDSDFVDNGDDNDYEFEEYDEETDSKAEEYEETDNKEHRETDEESNEWEENDYEQED